MKFWLRGCRPEVLFEHVEKAVSSIAWPIKVQNRHELRLALNIVRPESCIKCLGLVQVQGKERIGKDWAGFRSLEETNECANGKPKVALIADAKDFPQDFKGLAIAIREIDNFFGFLGVFNLFLGVWFCRFEDPLGTVVHDQGKGDHGVDGIDRETTQKEPVLVGNHIS